MDKLQYKDMLADAMSDLSTAEKEINRLYILIYRNPTALINNDKRTQ